MMNGVGKSTEAKLLEAFGGSEQELEPRFNPHYTPYTPYTPYCRASRVDL